MKKAFTLIELLIVVAIIAILAAIAVPNFLEARTRAVISRNKSDMRSAATALESYRIDHNVYPYDGYNALRPAAFAYWYLPFHISTPVSYLTTNVLVDPFRPPLKAGDHYQLNNVRYNCIEATWGTKFDAVQSTAAGRSTYYPQVLNEFGEWRLTAAGPDKTYGPNGWIGVSTYPSGSLPLPYDPTNGTISDGDIMRFQATSASYKNGGSNF